jgi:DNA-binding transcriptional ArsR family regulator
MIVKDPNLTELEANFLKALAQPTRLQILYFLRDGEQCQCKIIPRMREDQSNISRHLTHMRDLGILESRKEGVSVYYKIRDKRIFRLLSLADQMIKAEIEDRAKRAKVLV